MLTKADVLKIAKLARLHLSDDEVAALAKELDGILEYVKQLEKIDVTSVEPTSHVHGVTNVFRNDVVSPHLPVSEALRNAPDSSGRFIRVPIIIGHEGE